MSEHTATNGIHVTIHRQIESRRKVTQTWLQWQRIPDEMTDAQALEEVARWRVARANYGLQFRLTEVRTSVQEITPEMLQLERGCDCNEPGCIDYDARRAAQTEQENQH
jgi:hypothetical protein